MDTLWSFGNLGFNLINFVDRNFSWLTRIMDIESPEQELCLRNANDPGIMVYEMNCSEKEHSLIRMTENLLCCVFLLIFFIPDQGDEGCSCTLSKLPDARFHLKNHTVLNFFGRSFKLGIHS